MSGSGSEKTESEMHVLSSHPSRADLYEYAEQIERNAAEVAASVHAHALECAQCSREIKNARMTVAVANCAAALEPGREWRARMLLAARQERGRPARASVSFDWRANRRTFVTASAVVLIASASVAAVRYERGESRIRSESAGPSAAAVFPLDVLRQATPEERLLAPAVMAEWDSVTPWEASQRRAVSAWDAEIDDALEALENNPACVRAAALVNTNRERLGETLKVLYVERSL